MAETHPLQYDIFAMLIDYICALHTQITTALNHCTRSKGVMGSRGGGVWGDSISVIVLTCGQGKATHMLWLDNGKNECINWPLSILGSCSDCVLLPFSSATLSMIPIITPDFVRGISV